MNQFQIIYRYFDIEIQDRLMQFQDYIQRIDSYLMMNVTSFDNEISFLPEEELSEDWVIEAYRQHNYFNKETFYNSIIISLVSSFESLLKDFVQKCCEKDSSKAFKNHKHKVIMSYIKDLKNWYDWSENDMINVIDAFVAIRNSIVHRHNSTDKDEIAAIGIINEFAIKKNSNDDDGFTIDYSEGRFYVNNILPVIILIHCLHLFFSSMSVKPLLQS